MHRTNQTTPIDEQIMAVLADGKPRSRDEILSEVLIPRSTVYYSLQRLIYKKRVESWTQKEGLVGRPKTYFCVFLGE